MTKNILRHSIPVLCVLLASCGFQLRGTGLEGTMIPEDWKSMHLVSPNPNSELSREVQSRFIANGIEWQDSGTANYTLKIGEERFTQHNLSLNSEARAAEYELTLKTKFTVYDAERNVIIEERDIKVVKQMENDPRNVVGKSEEVRLLRQEMRTELTRQLLRTIAFFAATDQNPQDNAAG